MKYQEKQKRVLLLWASIPDDKFSHWRNHKSGHWQPVFQRIYPCLQAKKQKNSLQMVQPPLLSRNSENPFAFPFWNLKFILASWLVERFRQSWNMSAQHKTMLRLFWKLGLNLWRNEGFSGESGANRNFTSFFRFLFPLSRL